MIFIGTFKYCSAFFYFLLTLTSGSQLHEIPEAEKIRTINKLIEILCYYTNRLYKKLPRSFTEPFPYGLPFPFVHLVIKFIGSKIRF